MAKKTAGANGRERGGFTNNRRFDRPYFTVVAFFNVALEFLAKMTGVKVGNHNTVFYTTINSREKKAVLKAAEEMRAQDRSLPKPPDFKFRTREEFYPDDQAAQVVVTTYEGNPLNPEIVRVNRDDETGRASYPALSHCAIVKCAGNDFKFRIWKLRFAAGSRENDRIGIQEEFSQMDMPAALQPHICTGDKSGLPTLTEVAEIIAEEITFLRDEHREVMEPYSTAMAVAYLMANGAKISMQDLLETTEESVAEQMTEATSEKTTKKKPAAKKKESAAA